MLHVLIFVFLAATISWLFYWAIVRQSIVDSVEDDLNNLKDKVTWNIINDAPGSRSKSAQLLVEQVENNSFIAWISFTQVAICLFRNRTKIRTEAAREMAAFESSPKWILDARDLNARLTVKAALANSPVWWIPLPAILLGGIFSKQVLDWWSDAGSTALANNPSATRGHSVRGRAGLSDCHPDNDMKTIEQEINEQIAAIESALNSKSGAFSVKLSNVGNPDYGQYPDRPLPETVCGWARVDTLKEAVTLCRLYMEFYDLGGGNWNGGLIQDANGLIVGRVSYNGRVWSDEHWTPNTKEIFA